jgi:hypothetical protein
MVCAQIIEMAWTWFWKHRPHPANTDTEHGRLSLMCNKEDGNKKVFDFDELLEYYKTENLNLIPLKHGDKKPVVEWKDYQTRRITKEEIDKFFRDGTHNIGVVCGAISDYLFVLDFDEPDLFDRYFEKKDGLVYVKTGRGFHVYFKADKPVKTLKCFDADGRELLTLKGEASYVVAPPSLHSNGKLYEFMKRGEIPRLSGDARQHVKARAEAIGLTAPKESIDIETILKGVPEGGRDTALTHIIHFLRRAGTDKKDVLSISEKWNLKNKPPLEQTKLKEKVDYHFKIAEPYKYFFSLDPGQWYITDELTLETKKADAKSAAIARQHGEQEPTLDEVLEMEDDTCDVEIINYTVLKKVVNGTPQNFYVETQLVNGEIEMALTHSRAIPVQTAPSLDFCTCDYNSLHEIYIELRKEITDYIAFANDSIAPDLIALGSVASYFREVFYTFPYYDYISSEPEAGKTTAMKVQTFTSFYGTIASSITEALLFREIDGSHCFYGLDNIERLFASPKDYASIIDWLLSSYSRDIPCKRLEKTDEGYEVRYFDGYGIKAFTHIRDFPFGLRALRSRCIQIVMQNAPPSKFYPTAEKFTAIRDKLYKARLYEFDVVKETYEELIASNVLRGRTGDLYYPLLAIAKLVNEELYNNILKYATTDEVERKELCSAYTSAIKK